MTEAPPLPDPRRYPTRPWAGVGVVVWRGHSVLLVRRGKPPRQGEWGIPGGVQELGETLHETAVREILEETGLTIRPVQIIDAVDSISRDEDGRIQFHYTLVSVSAEFVSGEATALSDVDEVRWATPDEVAGLVRWEPTIRVIAEAAQRRKA